MAVMNPLTNTRLKKINEEGLWYESWSSFYLDVVLGAVESVDSEKLYMFDIPVLEDGQYIRYTEPV